MAMKRWLPGLAALPICALPVIWAGQRAPVLPASVILITLDTTRADHLPPYDDGFELPAIEQLAREGVVFERAIAPVPLTLPSHSSLFTGRIPPAHGARVNGLTLEAGLPMFP